MTHSVYMRVSARGELTERIFALPVDAWQTAYAGEDGSYLVQGDIDAALFWFDSGEMKERPVLADEVVEIAADGLETFRVEVPADGEAVYITGGHTAVDISDGVFEFQTTVPGEYRFEFNCFPYRKQIITVTAHG